jgi:HD-GYP domain-containing protein (c-di-GMP phosphodiesterase class II)
VSSKKQARWCEGAGGFNWLYWIWKPLAMPSHQQIWFSPKCENRRWAAWLRSSTGISARAADLRALANTTFKLEQRVVWIVDAQRDDLKKLRKAAANLPQIRVIGVIGKSASPKTRGIEWFAWLTRDSARAIVEKTVGAAFGSMELQAQQQKAIDDLARTEREMEQLHEIGIALSAMRDANAVLELILTKAREMTGADAGSIYLIEEKRANGEINGEVRQFLRFKMSQNDSVELPWQEAAMPISESSISGFVALHGKVINLRDAYHVPPSAPYHLNERIDLDLGYRTRSLLTLPMKNAKGEVLGVLQLINCKKDPKVKLTRPEMVARQVKPFSSRAVQFALSLASQAAVSYENSKLYQDIETLFEGFVQASVSAIEQRDPTTSGHSHRVSDMTCGLAEAVDRTPIGAYGDVRFTREQMKEIRYAALLHDFGKVAVREEVLVKAKKLYPGQLEIVQTRFDYAWKELEARYEKRKFDLVVRYGVDGAGEKIEELERELRLKLEELDDAFRFVSKVNEPTVMPEGNFERLISIGKQSFRDPRGGELALLTPDEIRFLSIPKGSLDTAERLQIESHVVHSFNFLMQIPWTREIRGIPAIARAHHEKLNGTGYPRQLKAEQIPVQAKIMTVCDIFDALSASDRPYKKAVSAERALEILELSVRDNELDPVLFQLFVDAKIYQLLHKSH